MYNIGKYVRLPNVPYAAIFAFGKLFIFYLSRLSAAREINMLKALLDINKISFPGLGIGEFSVNEVAFSVFGIDVAWYGIIVTLAIAVVCARVYAGAIKLGYKVDDILDYFIYSIFFGIIGARIYYVVFYGLDRYIVTDGSFWHNLSESFMNIIAIWNGGIAIYGGIIAIVITVIVVSKIKKIPLLPILDLAGHGAMIGQAIGRWGNFFNAEAHGVETDIFCRMGLTNAFGITICYHPTFFYESLWNVIGFILIFIFYKHRKYGGQIFLMYCSWYGFGRMFIEGLRTDSLYIGATSIRVSQLLGFMLFVIGTALLIYFGIKNKGVTSEKYISSVKVSLSCSVSASENAIGIINSDSETISNEVSEEDNDDDGKDN